MNHPIKVTIKSGEVTKHFESINKAARYLHTSAGTFSESLKRGKYKEWTISCKRAKLTKPLQKDNFFDRPHLREGYVDYNFNAHIEDGSAKQKY
jgi:hypothetical protein